MIDVPDEVGSVHREVRDGRVPAGEGKTVLIRRTYPSAVEDMWDAITDPERISR
ncbi:MAG: polyketide cyclase, partial [Micromonosporaceae bacterium]|nr:polyketide cyclase [Micromonosporaceae bacterium]